MSASLSKACDTFPAVHFIEKDIWLPVATLLANLSIDDNTPEFLRQEIRYFSEEPFLVLSEVNHRPYGSLVLIDELALASGILNQIFDVVPTETLQHYWYGNPHDFYTLKAWTLTFQAILRARAFGL